MFGLKRVRQSLSFNPLLYTPYAKFTDLTKINFANYISIHRKTVNDEQYSFTIDTPQNRIHFALPDDTTFSDFKKHFQKEVDPETVKDLKVFSIDLSEISNVSRLSDLSSHNYYVIGDSNIVYKVMSVDRKPAEISETDYQSTKDYFEKLGLPFLERKIVLNYLRRVDHFLEEELGKKIFTDHDSYNQSFDKNILIENMIEAIANNKNQQVENEEVLINQYLQLQEKLEEIQFQHALLAAKAHKTVKLKMSLGIIALLGHFSFVGIGTYVVYSWDMVEPMVYFISLGTSVVLSYQFFKTYRDFNNISIFKYMKEKELKKLYVKHNFPIDQMKILEDTVQKLEKKLKSNVLINL